MPAPLSIVIPTLNAAEALPETADALLEGSTRGLVRELVISDGRSTDETLSVARELGAIVVTGEKGRGVQIARGVEAARADWLLILHADTHLADGWSREVAAFIAGDCRKAGYFRLRFRSKSVAARFVGAGANLRSRLFGLPYGDQGLLIHRNLLQSVGGFPDLPLMEDVALARSLKGRLVSLDAAAMTSAERYESDGWTRRSLSNLLTLARYLSGTPAEALVAGYERRGQSLEN